MSFGLETAYTTDKIDVPECDGIPAHQEWITVLAETYEGKRNGHYEIVNDFNIAEKYQNEAHDEAITSDFIFTDDIVDAIRIAEKMLKKLARERCPANKPEG